MHVLFPLATRVHVALEQERNSSALGSIEATLVHLRRSRPRIGELKLGVEVVQLTTDIVLKGSLDDLSNHHMALQYLAEHAPNVPVPRTLGLVKVGRMYYLFMTSIPGQTLESAWTTLDTVEKFSIQMKLEEVCRSYRMLKAVEETVIGPLTSEKCEDMRVYGSQVYEFKAEEPIHAASEFEDFLFSYRPWIGDPYIEFCKKFSAGSLDTTIVFTHCDMHFKNIMVDRDEHGELFVTGIIDWEDAGFYPDYWEAVILTRCFLANNPSDWFLYIPPSISPYTYAERSLVDMIWDRLLEKLAPMDANLKKHTGRGQVGIRPSTASSVKAPKPQAIPRPELKQ